MAVPVIRAVLSCTPKIAIPASFTGPGTESTTTPPTASSGADSGPVSTATTSATPSATAAAATPDSPARTERFTFPSSSHKLGGSLRSGYVGSRSYRWRVHEVALGWGTPSCPQEPPGTRASRGTTKGAPLTVARPLRGAGCCGGSETGAVLVAVAAVTVPPGRGRLRLGRLLDHEALRGQQQRGDRDGVGDRVAGHLHRVDDAGGRQVDVLLGGRVEAVAPAQLGRLARHHVTVVAGVLGDPAQRLDERLAHDPYADGLLTGEAEVVVEHRGDLRQGGAAARDGALLDRGLGRRDGVLDAVLALLHLDLGRGTGLDDGDAAGELGQPLGELLAVPVGVRRLDLLADLRDAVLNLGLLATPVDDGGVLLVDHDAPGGAQHVDGDLVELVAELGGDELATGRDRHVLQHRLAPIPEAGGLHGGD